MRKAVENYFLMTDGKKNHYRKMLADYFWTQDASPRKISELPYLLFEGQDWRGLKACLLDLDVFSKFYNDETKYDIMYYWKTITKNLGETLDGIAREYQLALEKFELNRPSDEIYGRYLYLVAELLRELALNAHAEELYKKAMNIQENVLSHESYASEELIKKYATDLSDTLEGLSWMFTRLGRYNDAEFCAKYAVQTLEKYFGTENFLLVRTNLQDSSK